MRSKLLLHLLTARPRSGREGGFTMIAGILVILALVVGTLGVVAIVNGANLGIFGSGEARDSQQVAEAGADQIIATFNQPENRQLLVAGSTAPNKWSTSNTALQSPCLSSKNTRPGANQGFPTAQAVSFADGKFRNLENLTETNKGTRQFVLKAIRYSAGEANSTNRRSIYVGYKADGTALTTGGTIPTGSTFNSLINLESGTNTPAGNNSGFIAVEVEGRLYRSDGTYSSTTITKEYEVMPKCCGGSFGSQGSGGSNIGYPFGKAGATGALGADSRYCGLEWGMITGINNGRFYSQAAIRRYTRRNESGAVVPIGSILGVIANKGDVWDRGTNKQATLTVPAASGGFTYTGQIGCRTVPSPCSVSTDIIPASNLTISSQYTPFTQSPTPGICPDVPTMNQIPNASVLGDANSIAGRSASCIPFVPLYLSSGLPSIASKYTHSWASGGNPETISKSNATSASNIYPSIIGLTGDATDIWLRANRATQLDQKASTGSAPYTPFVEYCSTKYLANNNCVTSTPGSNGIHTWAIISQPGAVIGGIQDAFNNNNFTSYDSASTPRWPTVWQTNTSAGLRTDGTASSTDLNFTDRPQFLTFKHSISNATAAWSTNYATLAPAIARAVNLYSLRGFAAGGITYGPVIEFQFQTTGAAANPSTFSALSALRLDYSFAGSVTTDSAVNTDTGWVQLGSVSAGGTWTAGPSSGGGSTGSCSSTGNAPSFTTTCRIAFPAAAVEPANRFSHYVKFRLRANSNYSTLSTLATRLSSVALDYVTIKGDTSPASANYNPQYKNWCEFNSSRPATILFPNGGFHCVGPTIDLRSTANDLYVDTTDGSISLYYNSSTDFRGNDTGTPVVNLRDGGSISNVQCSRANQPSTLPVDNCRTPVDESVYAPVGEYDYFNIFGRDTPPGNTCAEMGLSNQPCNQNFVIGTDASLTATDRARIAGAWFYLPWGAVSFASNSCGTPTLPDSFYYGTNDSWNFAGRIWVRTILACGQNHFRVPPSSSSSLNALIGEFNTANTGYIGWAGTDWVARSPMGTIKGSLN